jgi:competence protein ComEC
MRRRGAQVLRRPVAVLAAAYAAGIFIERFSPCANHLLYGVGACSLAVVIVCAVMRRAAVGTVFVVLLAAVLGALAYAPFHTLPIAVRQLEGWLHRPVVVEGVVRHVEPGVSGGLRITLCYDSIEIPGEQLLCSGFVLVTLNETIREYRYGQRLRISCRLSRPRNFNNPGGFDYERFLAHRTLYIRSFLNDDRTVVLLRENDGNALKAAIERYRSRLRRFICECLKATARDMVLALLLGEKQTLDPLLREQIARLGVAHLLAISGLHIGIVAGLAFALACFVLRCFPRLLLYIELWKAAALFSIVPVVVYCCIAGLQIPTLRAGIMIVVCIIALLVNRRHDIFNALALACFIILIWMPASLFEISFQLSVSAVFFLIVCAPYAQKLLAAPEPIILPGPHPATLWLYRFLGGIFSASLIAAAATAPLTAFYFQQVSPAGILANCVLVPAIGFGAVPCCLVSAVLLPVSETAARGCLHAGALILEQAVLWIRFWSDFSPACVHIPAPSTEAIAAYFILLVCLLCGRRKRRVILVSLLAIAVAVLWVWQPLDRFEGLLRVTFLDVGHGDATVIQFPQGQVMLIDSGGLRSDHFDTGKSIVAPALRALGIRQVNWLVISHPHHDHMAGMPFIAAQFNPGELWTPMRESPDHFFTQFLLAAWKQGIRVRFPARGTQSFHVGKATLEFLSPGADQAASARTYPEVNDSSLVMKLSYGDHSFLFTGDIGHHQEQALLDQGIDLRARVLKVPHHGRRGSSSPEFLDAVNPDTAVFSCRPPTGRDISADVLKRYKERAVDVLRTDKKGAVQITSNGSELKTYTFLPCRKFMPYVPDPV